VTVSAFSLVIPVQLNTSIIIVILFLYFVEQINVMMMMTMMMMTMSDDNDVDDGVPSHDLPSSVKTKPVSQLQE